MTEQVWYANDVLIEFANDDPVAKNSWLLESLKDTRYTFEHGIEKSTFFVPHTQFAHFMHMLFLNCNDPDINVIRVDFDYAIPFETVDGKYNTQQVTLRQVAR